MAPRARLFCDMVINSHPLYQLSYRGKQKLLEQKQDAVTDSSAVIIQKK